MNKCERCEKHFKIKELSFTTLHGDCETSRYSIKLICPCCGFDKFSLHSEKKKTTDDELKGDRENDKTYRNTME